MRWSVVLLAALVALAIWALGAVARPRDPLLAGLERKVHLLIAALQAKHPGDDRVTRLASRWDGRIAPLAQPGAGQTVNKRHVSLCTRDLGADPNTAFMVLAHELGHVCTESEGHTQEFWDNFRFLLKEAVAAGLYTYQAFEASPVTFCGAKIVASPLTCVVDGTCV